jgi:DNA-binding transcriptional LysR family regulator
MRQINLDQLRTLVTIAEMGSFAAAAKKLYLAPPTISLHVAELESRFGTTLLLRQRQRVVPTGVGFGLIERARRLLADIDLVLEEVSNQVEGRAGRVRLGASTGALAWLLPRALETMRHKYPEIDVQVSVLTSREAVVRVEQGKLDIGLVALPQAVTKGVQIAPWRCNPVMAFVPHSWSPPRTITPAWLAARPLILNDASTRMHRLIMDWFAAAGEQPRAHIELNFSDAIKSLVATGYGAALLPWESSCAAVDARVVVASLNPQLWRPLGLAYREGPQETAIQHMLDALVAIR